MGGRSEWSPGRSLFPGKGPPGTRCTGGWVGLRAGLDTEARRKVLSPLPGIELRSSSRPACSQTLYWLSYPAHTRINKQWKWERLLTSIVFLRKQEDLRVNCVFWVITPWRRYMSVINYPEDGGNTFVRLHNTEHHNPHFRFVKNLKSHTG
jgi:hypothetical protein